ncbi:hypothetical protein [Tropicibacter oceani]|uniref:Lipoprotein n=1 Tax=Tropicibacter oceani TaxID=3058420 RepID=A0ABY8QH38_9RHOB|nr:hypothetical protein [Tropicibacter oceani]WGW03117.1 hypothetical protein QF118_14440 [Tropicibacter oceani]
MIGLRGLAALALAALVLGGCAGAPSGALTSRSGGGAEAGAQTRQDRIAELGAAIAALGPNVDPDEATRAARIAIQEPLQWAIDWQVVDPPLIHNMKVNSGLRPRGLCKDWADDLQARMAREDFQTLDWHRAIANHDTVLIEHSTLIVSAKGAAMQDGIVLDPWRQGGGRLFHARVPDDPKYRWTPRAEVFALKRKWRAARNAPRPE